MKKVFIVIVYCFCFSLFSAEISGEVTRIISGDTIVVKEIGKIFFGDDTTTLGAFEIKLANVNAPDISTPMGRKSKTILAMLIDSREVTVRFWTIDKKGRLVGIVKRSIFGENINEYMIGHGWAKYEKDGKINPRYASLQAIAQEKKLGLWGNDTYPFDEGE